MSSNWLKFGLAAGAGYVGSSLLFPEYIGYQIPPGMRETTRIGGKGEPGGGLINKNPMERYAFVIPDDPFHDPRIMTLAGLAAVGIFLLVAMKAKL